MRIVKLVVALLIVGAVFVLLTKHRTPPPVPEKLTTSASLLSDWTDRYGPEVVAQARASGLAHGWTPTEYGASVGRRPLAAGVRQVRQEVASGDAGYFAVWEWDDGNPDTIEGTVEVVRWSTGERFLVNMQLYQPEWDLLTVEPEWLDVLWVQPGSLVRAPVTEDPRPRLLAASYRPVQYGNDWTCTVTPGELGLRQWSCVGNNFGRMVGRVWKSNWVNSAYALGGCLGGWGGRLACAKKVGTAIGIGFAAGFTNQLIYGEADDCSAQKIYDQLCLANTRKQCKAQGEENCE